MNSSPSYANVSNLSCHSEPAPQARPRQIQNSANRAIIQLSIVRYASSRLFMPRAAIFVSVQPTSTTLFGVPFPLPTPQGRRDSHLRTLPKREIRMLRKATPRTWRPLRQIYQGRSARVAARPEGQAAPSPRIQSSGAIVTSQPWIQMTGGYARNVIGKSLRTEKS